MLTCNVVTVQHRKHTDSGKIYIQARTSRKDIFLLFGNEDSKFHNCTTELLTRRNCIFFLINRTRVLKVKVSHVNISYQNGQTCQHLTTHSAGKMGRLLTRSVQPSSGVISIIILQSQHFSEAKTNTQKKMPGSQPITNT